MTTKNPTLKPGSIFAPDLANPTGQRAAPVQDLAIKSATRLPTYDRWLKFHRTTPGVYRALEGLALLAVRTRTNKKFGVKALWEVARWEDRPAFKRLGKELGENWQMPNDYTALYGRLLAEMHPEFLGDKEQGVAPYFEMRKLRSSQWPTDPESVAARRPPALKQEA